VYDTLTGRYTFSCPARGEAKVRLSAFRTLERLPGTAHPVVFRVRFACACGGEHDGLVSHDELDWAPIVPPEGSFLNLMTDRLETLSVELAELAAVRIRAGEWPWSFFCYPEERPRPIFPSAFRLLAPGTGGSVGVAIRCPVCAGVSVNLVSPEHLDLPFHNDHEVGVVEHVFPEDAERAVEAFRAELDGATFDARRLGLE
jgi:hypothetical protein